MKNKMLIFLVLSAFVASGVSFASQKLNISGTWEGPTLVEGAGIELILTLVVEQKSSEIQGKINDDQGFIDCEIKDPKLEGNTFTFVAVAVTPDGDYEMFFEVTIEGNTMTGSWETEGIYGEWTAEKK
ncbi:MAG: hypothetical protein PVF22_01155 [Candidatus Aminicenantes bacterium]|jgi:hypothetical protein